MHAGDYQVHLLEHRIGKIKRAVAQNIHFDPRKNPDPLNSFSGPANSLNVLNRARIIQPIRERQVLRMVRNGHVLVPMLPRRLRHLHDCVSSVGLDGVHVHIAMQIFLRNQSWQLMLFRQINFPAVLAHFRRNVVQLQRCIDFLFRFSRHHLLIIQLGQTVFIQRVSQLERPLPQRHIVPLRSGKVLHRRPK